MTDPNTTFKRWEILNVIDATIADEMDHLKTAREEDDIEVVWYQQEKIGILNVVRERIVKL